jgi:hypothetical protein
MMRWFDDELILSTYKASQLSIILSCCLAVGVEVVYDRESQESIGRVSTRISNSRLRCRCRIETPQAANTENEKKKRMDDTDAQTYIFRVDYGDGTQIL